MAQPIWVGSGQMTNGKIDHCAEVYDCASEAENNDTKFLALTMDEVAGIREVIRKPDQCDRCNRGKVYADMYDANPTPCAECSGTGLGPRVRKVLEMLR